MKRMIGKIACVIFAAALLASCGGDSVKTDAESVELESVDWTHIGELAEKQGAFDATDYDFMIDQYELLQEHAVKSDSNNYLGTLGDDEQRAVLMMTVWLVQADGNNLLTPEQKKRMDKLSSLSEM